MGRKKIMNDDDGVCVSALISRKQLKVIKNTALYLSIKTGKKFCLSELIRIGLCIVYPAKEDGACPAIDLVNAHWKVG